MQEEEEDWGTYSQASWMTGGAWEDRDKTHRRFKKSSPTQPPTTPPHVPPPYDDHFTPDETTFHTAVDLADLQTKLRRWTFARSWKTASSNPSAEEETNISPLSRPTAPIETGPSQTDTDRKTPPAPRPQHPATPPLDEDVMAQYLNRCIAAVETQLAGARDKSKGKNGAVKEIERLVEQLVRQAELGE